MHPANIEKIEAPKNATLVASTTLRDPEEQSLNIATAKSQPNNMPRIQYLCFTLLILAILGLTIVSAASDQQGHGNGISDAIAQEKLRFQELLNSVEPSSLHEVLHTHMKDRYKHGVYQEDKHAMEVVHQENAVVAHSLLELAKRQTGGNGTTVVIVTSTASVNTETTTTATQTAAPTTTSDNSPPPSTSSSSQAAAPTTSPQVQQTSSPSVQSTSSEPPASTNAKSSASVKATPAASRSVTQQVLYTSTLPNGGVSTITSLTVVPADQAQTAGGGTSTNTAKASLQTNSAIATKALGINGVLGALGLIVVVGGL